MSRLAKILAGSFADTDRYYQALGRFVAEFSAVELLLQSVLWQLTRMNVTAAKAVFSGVRTEDACNKITRIGVAEAWNAEKTKRWGAISSHLGLIRELRNDILHLGASWQGGEDWLITNKGVIHTEAKLIHVPVTVAILKDATADLERMTLLLFNFAFEDDLPEAVKGAIHQALKSAWRYTPSPQAIRPGRTPAGVPKQPRPPRPSSASRRKEALERQKNK
jgi:hypothetical protein